MKLSQQPTPLCRNPFGVSAADATGVL
jgi:hypothetical protein